MSVATLMLGDCRERMRDLPEGSVEAVVCDPPYELGFMGRAWDRSGVAYDEDLWREVLRVLKPGGHLAAFGGTRTYHRMAVAIEDAGFEIRDQLAWVYGSGFPKSLDVSKAIDKAAGAEREIVGTVKHRDIRNGQGRGYGEGIQRAQRGDGPVEYLDHPITAPATDAAREWQGWGTALKPSWEPICLARKPLQGTVAANVLAHGTGALNIDGCRIEHGDDVDLEAVQRQQSQPVSGFNMAASKHGAEVPMYKPGGRWPANLCHDGSEEVLAGFPESSGGHDPANSKSSPFGGVNNSPRDERQWSDSGSAARFFYCAKADGGERAYKCLICGLVVVQQSDQNCHCRDENGERRTTAHPTVKPIDLMCWLVRLVTPTGGTVLDPFMGTGSTGLAAHMEQMNFIGCEMDADYLEIAERRLRRDAGLFAQVTVV